MVALHSGKGLAPARCWIQNQLVAGRQLNPARFQVQVAPRGITALAIAGLNLKAGFQEKFIARATAWQKDFVQFDFHGAHGMILPFGRELQSAYVYLQANGEAVKQATLHYSTGGGEWRKVTDAAFPFEFTVPLAGDARQFEFKIEVVPTTGAVQVSEVARLSQ